LPFLISSIRRRPRWSAATIIQGYEQCRDLLGHAHRIRRPSVQLEPFAARHESDMRPVWVVRSGWPGTRCRRLELRDELCNEDRDNINLQSSVCCNGHRPSGSITSFLVRITHDQPDGPTADQQLFERTATALLIPNDATSLKCFHSYEIAEKAS
jgi:hypothetical protein